MRKEESTRFLIVMSTKYNLKWSLLLSSEFNQAKAAKPTHISGMKYLVWLPLLTKSIEIGANPPFYCVVCWHRLTLPLQKHRYLSTNLAIRLAPNFSLAASGIANTHQGYLERLEFQIWERRTWLMGALEPQFTNTNVSNTKT